MTDEQFRAACERAGLIVRDLLGGWYVTGPTGHSLSPRLASHREWIMARCASLLMAQVRGKYGAGWRAVIEGADIPQPSILATDEQRIVAAMEVLDG